MSFSQKIKDKVLEMSDFRCCICEKFSMSIEIHHIISQEEGGSDTIDNAAPLCPNCHSDYGDNKKKRTYLKKKRNYWFEKVQRSSGIQVLMDLKEIKRRRNVISINKKHIAEQNSQTPLVINQQKDDYMNFDFEIKIPKEIEDKFKQLNNEYQEEDFDNEDYIEKFCKLENERNITINKIFDEKAANAPVYIQEIRKRLLNEITSILVKCRQVESWDDRSEMKLYQWLENRWENEIPISKLNELLIIKDNLEKYLQVHINMIL